MKEMIKIVDTTLAIYKQNVPLGFSKIVKGKWDSATQPEIKVEPAIGYILLVKRISFKMSDDFELSGTDAYMRMQHSKADGTNVYQRLDFADSDELLAACESVSSVDKPSATGHIVGAFDFFPPIRCRQSLNGEYFTIVEEGSLTVAGDVFITVHAWQMQETEFDES